MAPNNETPRKRGRPRKSVPMNVMSVMATAENPQTPRSSVKRKKPSATLRRTSASYSATFISMIELLNDLTSFCGVGSLEIKMPRRAAAGMEASDNWLWLEFPPYKFPKSSIEASLQELVDRGVMRCTYLMVSKSIARVRVYVLPDDVGRSMIERDDPNLRKWLKVVMDTVDVSIDGWEGRTRKRELLSKSDDDKSSLFYMFNTLKSPKPEPESSWIKDENTKELLRDVLAPENKIPGMTTTLYKHQKRTAALMLQKELAPERTQDPRLREVHAPTGEVYYIDLETMEVFQEPRYYEDVKGGILAEEMGTGKTLICLAVILASKHQVSSIPEEHAPPPLLRKSVPSLSDLCIAAIWGHALPWTQYEYMLPENCTKKIKDNHGFYEVPQNLRSRSSRYSYDSSYTEKIYLGTGTIIVCPQNLVHHWQDEINKHMEAGTVKVLTLAQSTSEIPSVSDLLSYDILLFSRPRFDAEAREGRDARGRTEFYGAPLICRCPYKGSTRIPDCVCFKKEATYKSPLMSIQWKRLIVDEGHSMASNGVKTNGVCVAERLPVERRWIVTGTPTSELVGVMPGMVRAESEAKLEERKERQTNEALHLERIGKMVCDFLKQKPWVPMDNYRGSGGASWKRYITKGFTDSRLGSTACVRGMFQRLFIRHRPEDIEDVNLPPPRINEIWLQPGFYEKLSTNLFVGALATNSVTSERTDKDYMFHPANRGSLKQLTDNLLKRSGFYFPGHSAADVVEAVKTSRTYLMTHMARTSQEDKSLLYNAINAGEMALGMETWREMSVHHEMVYFLSDFPEQLAPVWSFNLCRGINGDSHQSPNQLLGMDGNQVQNLQKSVNAHASEYDLTQKLLVLGNDFHTTRLTKLTQAEKKAGKSKDVQKGVVESSMNSSSLVAMRVIDKKGPLVAIPTPNAKKDKNTSNKTPSKIPSKALSKTPRKSALKKSEPISILPLDSPLAKARIVGTASVKLTYLLNKIVEHHKTEKILIFFEVEDVAWYITQALEILGIENLAYSKGLSVERRSAHLFTFQNSDKYRVLLMDLNQAAHGLNISCASRVFFVNPVWRRDIEQQALKRAHRIGQTKIVHVETLILAGTIEEAMWKRQRTMTEKERDGAKGGLVEDSKMRDIISNLEFLTVKPAEGYEVQQVSMLTAPEPIFGDGKHGGVYDEIEHVRPSPVASISTPSVRWALTPPATMKSNPQPIERVISDLPVAGTRESNTRVKIEPPMTTVSVLDDLVTSDLPGMDVHDVDEVKRFGFKAGDNRDWMEDSDDDYGAPAIKNSSSKSVIFG